MDIRLDYNVNNALYNDIGETMLQGMLIKKIVDIIMKQFKLDEVNKQIKSIQRSVNKYGKYIEDMEKDIAEMKSAVKKLKIFK